MRRYCLVCWMELPRSFANWLVVAVGFLPLRCESMFPSLLKVRWLRMTAPVMERVAACSSQAGSEGPAKAGPQAFAFMRLHAGTHMWARGGHDQLRDVL